MAIAEISQSSKFNEAYSDSPYEVADGERVRSCLQCGTCSGVCPFGYLMDYPPGRMIAVLRAKMFDTVMTTDTVWMCVSCYACTQVCPAKIPLTLGLMTRAKEELLLAGNIPTELQDALQNSQRYGNPLGESPRKRADWVKGITPPVPILRKAKKPVDVLWFVGDYSSYHPRVRITSQALARVLNVLGVDFGILGPEENSDGWRGNAGCLRYWPRRTARPLTGMSSRKLLPPTRTLTTRLRTSIRLWVFPIRSGTTPSF